MVQKMFYLVDAVFSDIASSCSEWLASCGAVGSEVQQLSHIDIAPMVADTDKYKLFRIES